MMTRPYIETRGIAYQISRLHEDLLEILHSIVEPLPKCITDVTAPVELDKNQL